MSGPPNPGSLPTRPFVYRVLPDGTADPTFANNRVEVGGEASGVGLAISGQRHYIALNFEGYHGPGACGVAQVDGSGDLVPGFGDGGVVRLAFGDGFPLCSVTGISVDHRGRPVLMITRSTPVNDGDVVEDAVAVRFRLNGTLDPTFGARGIYAPATESPSTGGRIAVGSDQRIHMSWFEPVDSTPTLTVARVTRNADRGRNGALWTWQNPFPNPISARHTLQPEPDGGTFLSTLADVDGQSTLDIVLARLTPQGRLDPAFGDGGVYVEYSRETPDVLRFTRNHFLGRDADGSVYAGTRITTGTPLRDSPAMTKYHVEDAFVHRAPVQTALVTAESTVAPNPSAGPVTVQVRSEAATTARVRVFDTLGRLVSTLHDGPLAGPRDLLWTPPPGTTGTYLVLVEVDGRRESILVTLVR